MDSHAENFIQETLHQLRKEHKTIIIIAHRLSTVVHADNIMVLSDGKLIEEGSHQDLWARRAHYYKMWQQQLPSQLQK
ncbi:MAG: hypothetical protein ACPHVX_05910 [Flavobacteriaceae bacterium]